VYSVIELRVVMGLGLVCGTKVFTVTSVSTDNTEQYHNSEDTVITNE